MPGVKTDTPDLNGKVSYLLVEAGAVMGALVEPVVVVPVSLFSLHPVSSAPATRPNRTTRMYILFIVAVSFTRTARMTSRILK